MPKRHTHTSTGQQPCPLKTGELTRCFRQALRRQDSHSPHCSDLLGKQSQDTITDTPRALGASALHKRDVPRDPAAAASETKAVHRGHAHKVPWAVWVGCGRCRLYLQFLALVVEFLSVVLQLPDLAVQLADHRVPLLLQLAVSGLFFLQTDLPYLDVFLL